MRIPHPRILNQILTPAEKNQWHAYLTFQEDRQRRAHKRQSKVKGKGYG